ncbi:MAG: phosphoribosylformylglycinamidine synthase subunit PurL, partial [Fimbriimonadaceae bacterium]|nr:phosphoribosylformylglycinamidine synthase subunit PurL [Fimbriimonadaceae bacterium]
LKLHGREPTYTELGMFAVMWSEHCGYKFSRPILAAFKKYKEAMEGSGLENAGIVEIGDGLGVTMKVESHNHPSAVEPYQGAATGVGGIIRDILTMGARPIALLNSLRFGPIKEGEAPPEVVDRNRYLFEHVVAGIAGYGNCVGVPTVGGEVGFHQRYSGNPLVNAMCVGMLKLDEITTAAASGVGNPVIYLGSATGRDGIHGATFASAELDEESESKRPNVQIGDPFAEKLLIEATLEALRTGAVVAIQDMGAAGLTCSTVEMASKGKVGMRVDLDKVPMRESDMTGYELMLSESQERMLAVAHKGREQEVLDVFHKWGLQAVVIGEVTADGIVTVRRHDKIEAQLDPTLLTDQCPTYSMPAEVPAYHNEAAAFDVKSVPETDIHQALTTLLSEPEISSKRWVFQQYDQEVQTQTMVRPAEGDAAVMAPRGSQKGLALKIDGNSRWTYLDPYTGGQLAVVEAARNVACTGAVPRAVTDGLNFGNPQDPHVYWQFKEAVQGIADAAEAMHTPVISGNVSFYNESELGEVPPTPLIGMLGVHEHAEDAIGIGPVGEHATLGLLWIPLRSVPHDGLGASAYLDYVHGRETGLPVAPILEKERALCEILARGAEQGWIKGAHDLSDGGLLVAAAEVAMAIDLGLELDLSNAQEAFDYTERADARLFGELPGRVLVLLANEPDSQKIQNLAKERGIGFIPVIGRTREPDSLRVVDTNGSAHEWALSELQSAYERSIPSLMVH